MSHYGHAGDPQDPLEQYRQALRGQHPTGFGPRDAAEGPPAPVQPPAPVEPPAAEEPLAAEDPLDLDEPLDLVEPLELDEPLELVEPLELDEPLEAEEPLELGEPLAAEAPPAPEQTRSAADWLGLDEDLGAEDPLGLDDPVALEAAPPAASGNAQGSAAVDDKLPDELQDTLARYQKAMSKLRAGRSAEAADPLAVPQADPGGAPERPEPETVGNNELLNKYLKAVDRQQSDSGRASARAASAPSVSRETLNQFRKRRVESPEPPAADDLAAEDPLPDIPARVRAVPRVRHRARPAPQAASGWGTRAVTFAMLLFTALPIQWLVYKNLGVAFALADLGAGLSALLPAALILLLARPVSGKGQLVMVVGSAAVALIGSAGFAYGLSLLQNQMPQGASLLFGLLLTLGLFTAVWGPLFLILVPILSRTSLPARSSS